MSRVEEIVCAVDIEQTAESFHAHAVPQGIDIRPGDVVIMRDAPSVAFGEHVVCTRPATVFRAGVLTRLWTQACGLFELTELYEVGFQPKDLSA